MLLIDQKEIVQDLFEEVEVVKTRMEFSAMAEEWRRLLAESSNSAPWLSHAWLYSWWTAFADDRSKELYILRVSVHNKLVAIAPFYIDRKKAWLSGNNRLLMLIGQFRKKRGGAIPERQDIIIKKGCERQVCALLSKFLNRSRRDWSAARFFGISKQSNLYRLTREVLFVTRFRRFSPTSYLAFDLPETFDDFLSQQSSRWRSAYRGHLKLMALSGDADFRVSTRPHQVTSAIQSLVQINSVQQRKVNSGQCVFDSDRYLTFYEDISYDFALEDRFKVVSLIIDGRLLASASFFIEGDIVFGNQMGSVKGDGIRFSPLFVLMVRIIRDAIAQGYRRIEFPSDYIRYSGIKAGCRGQRLELFTLDWHKSQLRAYVARSVNRIYQTLIPGR